jgi:lysophospholipase L1-like esterase
MTWAASTAIRLTRQPTANGAGRPETGASPLAERARAHGICLIGATMTPYVGSDYYHPEAENEADRQELNQWIRSSGVFDAVADFDAALRDPAKPDRLKPVYDSGDHLHPSLAGYRALAETVPLAALRKQCGGAK